MVKQPTGRTKTIRWDLIRQEFIRGKITKLEDGTYTTNDYSLKELANNYEVNYFKLCEVARQQNWKRYRQAYLSRIEDITLQEELGYIDVAEYSAEVNTLNACDKISAIVDTYIESRFGQLLDLTEDTENEFSEEDIEEIVGQVDLVELKDAMKLVSDMYKLQKQVTKDTKSDSELYKRNKPKSSISDNELKQRVEKLNEMLKITENK